MAKRELRYLPAKELRVQTSPEGRTLSGYALTYNSRSKELEGFTEVIAPGAVTESLANNPDVLCLRGHDPNLLMGRTTSKTLILTDDAVGLRFLCKLPDTSEAASLAASVERGDLDGVSFGFRTIEDKWTSDEAGNVIRTLLKIDLLEVSPTSFAAYPAATVSVRGCPPELRSLLHKRSLDDGCDCDCEECQDGDCEDCSDPDCDDPNCDHNQRSIRHKMYMRHAISSRK
jgi:HK97 family phage prohead protease